MQEAAQGAVEMLATLGGFEGTNSTMSRETTIEDALKEIRRGRMVVVRDTLDRENEADLVMAARKRRLRC